MENKKKYRYCIEKKTIAEFDTIVHLYKYDTVSNVKVDGYRIKCEGIEYLYRDNGVSMSIFTDIRYRAELEDMEEIRDILYNFAVSYVKETQHIVSDIFINRILKR